MLLTYGYCSIFERLEQRGYGPEISHFRDEVIEKYYQSVFKKHNPLTDAGPCLPKNITLEWS